MTGLPREFVIAGMACRWQDDTPDALSAARQWLGALTGDDAASGLRRNAQGRPRLLPEHGDIGWSHTHGRLLLAHAPSGMVGVDVEHVTRRVDAVRIAKRHFSLDETAALQALDGPARTSMFLHLWCAREAVLKAHGHGLAFGLDRLAFRLDAAGLHMTACDPALGTAGDWRLHVWAPEQDYLAVLAWRDGILAR